MLSIERNYNRITKEHPEWSSLVCFSHAVLTGNYGKQATHRWFYKLVNKLDYEGVKSVEILKSLDVQILPEDDKI